jgi:hypothetical protein
VVVTKKMMHRPFTSRRFYLLVLTLVFATFSYSQSPYITINTTVDANGDYTYTFSPNTTLIEQDYPLDYTHPEAAYRYFWSLGDGTYSFDKTVEYSYKNNITAAIRLIGTPVYAPTLPPPAFTSTQSVQNGNSNPLNDDEMLILSRDPRPEFDSYAIINYENILTSTVNNAKLRFYFRSDYFEHLEDDLFHNESAAGPTADASLMPKYDNFHTYDVGSLLAGEKHTAMINIETLIAAMGELGEDLPTLFLKAELIYETKDRFGNSITHLIEDMELETEAVGGWDPNDKVALTDDLFYNEMANQEYVEYKINFQNIGTAPAKSVYIVDTFSIDYDSNTLVITDYYHPQIATYSGFSFTYNASERALKATFKNINLKGANQPSVTDEELTKGFIKFKIKTKPKVRFNPSNYTIKDSCEPYYALSNKAYITFDKNDTIETNTAYTHLYASSGASCLKTNRIKPRTRGDFKLVPNPTKANNINIEASNLSKAFTAFNNRNISIKLYNSSFSQIKCNLNPTYGLGQSANKITLNPRCLSTGIYYVLINYDNQVTRVMLVVL